MSTQSKHTNAGGTFYLIAIQVVSRGLTFVGNQALLRYVSPRHLGLAVQFEALSISVLYTARESLRVALQRNPQNAKINASSASQLAVNAAYLVVPLGFLLGGLLSSFYLYTASNEHTETIDFKVAFWLYSIATALEIIAEPCFVVLQQRALFKQRARAETTAAIMKCVTACSFAFYMSRNGVPMSVLPFAVGQLGYGLSLIVVYVSSALPVAAKAHFSLIPQRLSGLPDTAFSMLPKPLLRLAGAFYGQSIFKWLLTQGDTLVLSIFADLQSQGIFALASNYGGLASRLFFQPIEESSRNVFGKLLLSDNTSTHGRKAFGREPEMVEKRVSALNHLSTILHGYLLVVAIPCTSLLPQIFPLVIQTFLGSKSQWNSSQTSSLLTAYSYYIPCLAINGILDAFVTSVASEAELGAQSLMMIGVTMIYLNAAYLGMTVMHLGAVSLVYANILNMLLRIIFSIWFLRTWTQQNLPDQSTFTKTVRRILPNSSCLTAYALTLLSLWGQGYVKVATSNSSITARLHGHRIGSWEMDVFDLSYVFSIAVLLVSSIAFTESDFLLGTIEPLLPQRIWSVVQRYYKRIEQ